MIKPSSEQNQPKIEKYVKVIEGRRKGGEGVQELMCVCTLSCVMLTYSVCGSCDVLLRHKKDRC